MCPRGASNPGRCTGGGRMELVAVLCSSTCGLSTTNVYWIMSFDCGYKMSLHLLKPICPCTYASLIFLFILHNQGCHNVREKLRSRKIRGNSPFFNICILILPILLWICKHILLNNLWDDDRFEQKPCQLWAWFCMKAHNIRMLWNVLTLGSLKYF